MRFSGALVLLAVALAGCGSSDVAVQRAAPTASPSPVVREDEAAALLVQADRLAAEHEGSAVQVTGVRTRSSTAKAITGWSEQTPDEVVWVLAVTGDDYFCRSCSGPSDDGKRSTHLTLTVRADDPAGERLTFGMSLTPYDLGAYGPVQVLRGPPSG